MKQGLLLQRQNPYLNAGLVEDKDYRYAAKMQLTFETLVARIAATQTEDSRCSRRMPTTAMSLCSSRAVPV
jgi:hypothetical protein